MNWTFIGAFSYLVLFQASTWFTELISAEKYPEYKVYQERVGKFLPKGTTRSMDEVKVEEKDIKENKNAGSLSKGKGRKK